MIKPSKCYFCPFQSASFTEGKCICRCFCPQCAKPTKQSVGTQTIWNKYVKATQCSTKMVTKAVNAVPDRTNCETQTSVEVCDTGVDPFHVDSTVTGFDVPTACQSNDTGDDDSVSISGMEPDSQKGPDSDDDSDSDPTFVPELATTNSETPDRSDVKPEDDPKYIIFQSSLQELFLHCPQCGKNIETVDFISGNAGTLLKVAYTCAGQHSGIWNSQPLLKNRMAAGNLLLSAAILSCGASFERIREIAEVLCMPIMSEHT